MDSAAQDSTLSESMIKLLIIGGPQVGKSSLVAKFCNNTFSPNYNPTSGVHFKYKMLDFASKNVKVQVWDTAGTDHSNPLLKIYYKKAMGILLVFSLNEKQSLEDLEKWVQYLQNNANPNAIIILVGNKSDITERKIDMNEIKAFQKKYKVNKYVETSVKEGSSANEVFTDLVKEVIERHDKGSFKTEGHALNGVSTEKKAIVKVEQSIEKSKKKERDMSTERKEEEENITRKLEGLVEAAKKEISEELEQLKKSTKTGLRKLKEELEGKIIVENEKSNEEENIGEMKEELSFLRKAFESFSQSHPEEIFRHISKSDQTISSLVKQNTLLEERLSKLEQQNKNLEILNSDEHRSRSDKTDAEGSSVQARKVREASFDKTSRDPESTRNCSNSTEIFYVAGKKVIEPNDRRVIIDSINNPNAFLEGERIWEEGSPKKDIVSGIPQFYNSEEDDLYKTVEELQYNVAMLTQEVKKLQQAKIHVHTNKRPLRSRGKSMVKENRICQIGDLGGGSASEISGLWEAINNLVKNTHEEMDKVKEEVRRSRRRIGDRKDALVEKSVNGGMRELRDDIHDQLIEIQRELEGKYGVFRNNLTMNYESFLRYFHTEQKKLRDFMEDRCLEILEEALRNREKPEGYQIITSRRSLSGENTPVSIAGEGVSEIKSHTAESVEEMKKKKALTLKIVSIEAQQKQMVSSYTNSFKSVWETIHMLSDKVNSLDDKGSYIAEISRTGGVTDDFVDWRRMEY